jgi:transposase-like protein
MAQGTLSLIDLADRIRTEADAYEYLEDLRWQGDPQCPHCLARNPYFLTPKDGTESRKTRTGSRSERRVWKCRACRKQFSVLTGTIFHGTKIPLRKWVFVIWEMASNKNGIAAREIERKYALTPKSAWFMTQRIREAMKRQPMTGLLTGQVAVDETYIGGKPSNRHRNDPRERARLERGPYESDKTAVVALVHRETGELRAEVLERVTGTNLKWAILRNVWGPDTHLQTDGSFFYPKIANRFASHTAVDHLANQYVVGDATTNQLENFFSQLKRSIDGTHHHVSVEHLPRYLSEFSFRFNTCKLSDEARMTLLVGRVGGRRLTYKRRARPR